MEESMLLKRVPFAAAGLLAMAIVASPGAYAQGTSPDFPSQVQTTLPSNEQLLGMIQDTLPVNDIQAVSDQTSVSVSTGQDLVQQLNSALNLAPDDASRSRIEGVLSHVQAAVASLQMAQAETSLDAAHSRLNQARGEAQESLDELAPFVLGLVSTGAITGK
jgi:hypothetical protein